MSQSHPIAGFPSHLLLNQPERRKQLIQEYYEAHHSQNRNISRAKDEKKKVAFFHQKLVELEKQVDLGVDLGCRGGTITKHLLSFGNWFGVDLDRNAIELANKSGVPCSEMDISTAIDLRDECVDAVCLTEVLEHLPYPLVSVREIWRIMRKDSKSVFFGSVPLDYHLKRRISIARGRRLTIDPTHLHSFSYGELKALLQHYFEHVEFAAMHGTKTRHAWLSWEHFVRDIAWFAWGPRKSVSELAVGIL
jgi:SAM-dependent methyltransferase